MLDSFGETFSQGPGSTPGSRTVPNYGNLYLDGLIIPSLLKRFWPQNTIICKVITICMERRQIRDIESM
ncbi:unnamed protein product [Brassica rapa subsp. narinosa]